YIRAKLGKFELVPWLVASRKSGSGDWQAKDGWRMGVVWGNEVATVLDLLVPPEAIAYFVEYLKVRYHISVESRIKDGEKSQVVRLERPKLQGHRPDSWEFEID